MPSRKLKAVKNLKLVRSLDALMETAFSNCFPGANYQRLTTCLQVTLEIGYSDTVYPTKKCHYNRLSSQILDRFSSVFFDAFDPSCGVNKASGDGDPRALVRSCSEEHGLLVWHSRHVSVTRVWETWVTIV